MFFLPAYWCPRGRKNDYHQCLLFMARLSIEQDRKYFSSLHCYVNREMSLSLFTRSFVRSFVASSNSSNVCWVSEARTKTNLTLYGNCSGIVWPSETSAERRITIIIQDEAPLTKRMITLSNGSSTPSSLLSALPCRVRRRRRRTCFALEWMERVALKWFHKRFIWSTWVSCENKRHVSRCDYYSLSKFNVERRAKREALCTDSIREARQQVNILCRASWYWNYDHRGNNMNENEQMTSSEHVCATKARETTEEESVQWRDNSMDWSHIRWRDKLCIRSNSLKCTMLDLRNWIISLPLSLRFVKLILLPSSS